MKLKYWKLLVVLLIFIASKSFGFAAVDWEILKTLKIEHIPIDVAVSPDGKSIFVLNDNGIILIYTSDGKLRDKINIGTHVDHINLGPRGEHLFATNRRDKTVQIITLNFIHKIDITGSPFKGSQKAPLTLVVFSDFQ
jgi:DNA-binding beta-propeller fold protein YncE